MRMTAGPPELSNMMRSKTMPERMPSVKKA
jgi:hypothetical protein